MLDVEINTGINSSNNFIFLFFCQFAWHVETGVWFSSKLRFPGCWKGWFKHWFNCSKGWIRSWVRQEKPSDGPLARTGGKWSSRQGNLDTCIFHFGVAYYNPVLFVYLCWSRCSGSSLFVEIKCNNQIAHSMEYIRFNLIDWIIFGFFMMLNCFSFNFSNLWH